MKNKASRKSSESPEIMKKVRYIEEKQLMQKFLYEVGHDSGFITYGEAEVRRLMNNGAVRTVLLSEELDLFRVTVNAVHAASKSSIPLRARTCKPSSRDSPVKSGRMPAPSYTISDKKDIVDDIAELAANQPRSRSHQHRDRRGSDAKECFRRHCGVSAIQDTVSRYLPYSKVPPPPLSVDQKFSI